MANSSGLTANYFGSNVSSSAFANFTVAGIAGKVADVATKSPYGCIAIGSIIALLENQQIQLENTISDMKEYGSTYLVVTTSYKMTGYDTSGIPNYQACGVSYSY